MKKHLDRLTKLILIFGLIPVFLFGQATRYNEDAKTKTSGVVESYPVHVSHILNSPEEMAKFGPLNKERPLAKKVADTLGTIKIFKVYSFVIEGFEDVEFKLMRNGAVSQLWFATAEISNGHLTEDVADTMITYLESKTNNNSFDPGKGVIALGNDIFGNPPDYDGDGLSDVFVCDIQDGWDPEVGGGYTAGFFYSIDQKNHINSNMRDVIYIDSYPGIYRGEEANPLRPLSTLSHEYQHLIEYNYYGRLGNYNYTFINEAQSCFASLLTGYTPHSSYGAYLEATNRSIFQWNYNDVFPEYGRAAVFSSYIWDRWGFQNAGNLTSSGIVGVPGIESALAASGSDWNFADLLVNWGVANYVNDTLATGNRFYGYSNKLINSWQASPTVVVDDPNVTGEVASVYNGAISYLVYKGIKNLDVTVSFSGDYGRMKVITKRDDEVTVADLASGVAYSSPADVIYSEIIIMLVNTEPSGSGESELAAMDFTYTSIGTVSLVTESTYSTSKYYWTLPYYSTSSAANRYGFSNQFTVNPGGYLTKLRLYTVYGWNGEDSVKVWGEGQMRMAVYSDNEGIPGEAVHADTVDFSEIKQYWNEFNVSHWNYPIAKDIPFHVVYEFIVPVLNPDINSVPLRLDDGTGVQGVTNIVNNPSPFTTEPMFTDNDTGGQHNAWNEIVFLVDPAVAIEDENVFTPLQFRLAQNYPNPFNPTTVIKYQIPSASDVNLTIYNSVGQKVRTLYSGQRNAGTYEASWDGKNQLGVQVSSGIYFYQLKAGQQQQVNKMILMR